MTEVIGTAAGGHPDLNLSTEEQQIYGDLLKEADPDGFGAVSGDVAVKFFERTRLAPDVLGQIWQIADTENRGFLTPAGFGVVLRLIGHAQAGRVPAATLAPQPAPLPKFDSHARPAPVAAAPPIAAQYSGTPSSPTSSGPGPVRVPALTLEKANEYSNLFPKSGAENGILPGYVAKAIFEKARLPNEVLGRIWNLADTQGRGSLDMTEFVIAMHLLASYRIGAMRGVPSTLPLGLYDAAARKPPPRMAVSPRPGSVSGFAPGVAPGIAPQFSGFGGRPQSPITRQQAGTPLSSQSTGDGWIISPADKTRFDQIFSTIDRQNTGYINGEQAVGFFANARLPEETLAQIWDLADINSEGRLSRDEFAVAMYLIRQQRGTKDGRGNLPSTLPPALVPPSMRKQSIPPSQPTAPTFDNPPTQPRSAAEDLFGLDVLATSEPAPKPQPIPAQVRQMTDSTDVGPFGSPISPTVPQPAAVTTTSSIFKPFQPTSSFGQSMIPQTTGSPKPIQTQPAPAPATNEDLLGDTDVIVSSKLTKETAELGNLSNQVGTLSREMTDLQGKRSQADQELSQNAQQKRTFETRLSQLRAAFDKEVQEYKILQEKLNTSKNETKRLQQDIAMIEGSHADTRRQHDQLRSAYEADQKENTSLKERIRQANVEIDQIKPQIEKLKADARQQKGLVAINKKQLATNELERDRLQTELKAAQKEVEDAIKEAEESSGQVEVSKRELEEIKAQPKPTMPVRAPVDEPKSLSQTSLPLTSPTPSTMSNPFMRKDGSTFFSPPMGSPEPTHDHSAFDSIFGPSFGSTATAPPATSFRSETPPAQITSHENPPHIETGTPTSSVAPDVVEPPAPPFGKQITSDALPFRMPLERSESMTSSVKVVPPASRLSPADTPRAMTPNFKSNNNEQYSEDLFDVAAPDEEQESVRQTLPRADSTEKAVDIPGAFPAQTPQFETPGETVNPTAIAVGAGAAVVAAGAGLAAAATSQKEDEKQKEVERDDSIDNTSKTNHFDEYFGGPAHQRTPSEQVKDFDDAFASFKTGPTTGPPAKTADKEFPDIQEMDDGDSSSEYSQETPLGFDDDFNAKPTGTTGAPATVPTADTDSKAAGKQPEVASAVPAYLQPRQLPAAASSASSLPGIDQQTPPPQYVPDQNPSHFPMEYKGLLPEREDPTSPPLPTAGGSANPGSNPSGLPPTYGPEVAKSQSEAVANTKPPTTAKSSAFDFDSAFAGMGPAHVNEEDSDEEDMYGGHRNQTHEFDPSFDSPAQSRAPTVASTTQSPMMIHDAVTNGAPRANTASTNFFTFNDNVAAAAPTQVTGSNIPAAVSHDWDALFAPLSSPPANTSAGLGTGTGGETERETQHTEISPDFVARTSATEISGASTPIPAAATLHTSLPPSQLKAVRPQPGRALSTGTEHDDPILKRLTAMGWSRTESLAALEKFDYNLDKAADYLTFKS